MRNIAFGLLVGTLVTMCVIYAMGAKYVHDNVIDLNRVTHIEQEKGDDGFVIYTESGDMYYVGE